MPTASHPDPATEPATTAEPAPAGPAALPAHHQPESGPAAGPRGRGSQPQPPGLLRPGPDPTGHLGWLQVPAGRRRPQPLQPRQLGPRGGADSKPRLGHEILPVSPPLESPPVSPPYPSVFPPPPIGYLLGRVPRVRGAPRGPPVGGFAAQPSLPDPTRPLSGHLWSSRDRPWTVSTERRQ